MKLIILAVLTSGALAAAIGDNAPSIPPTYVASHPRLPTPDATYLNNIWTNRAGGSAYIWTDATAWSSMTPGGNIPMRHLLLAYAAEKLNSGPNVAAFLAQIQAFDQQNGAWSGGTFNSAIAQALAYDWFFADLGGTVQAQMRTNLYAMQTTFETSFSQESPFNDQFYNRSNILPLLTAVAIYPDDPGNSLPHLRFAMDVELNMMLPVWKQVIGGSGYCAANTNSSVDCGGAWHESWVDYVTKAPSLSWFYSTEMLAWDLASGRDTANVVSRGSTSKFFNTDNPWMLNFMDWTMYDTRPDFTLEPIEPMQTPFMEPEVFGASAGYPAGCTSAGCGIGVGFTSCLPEIYNSPTYRGWSRMLNFYGQTPPGYEPACWPFFDPDSSGQTATGRSSLSTVRNFPGNGRLVVRTGWGEDDTVCYFIYRDNEWSHPVADAGALNCYKNGALTIRSGEYIGGSSSDNWNQWAARAISQNVGLVYDSGDLYNSELYPLITWTNTASNVPLANDGGQRAVGSQLSNLGGSSLQSLSQSPSDIAQYARGHELYHMGKLINYANGAGNKYTYACADITDSYNNLWSRTANTGNFIYNQANTSNRSFRVQKYVRCVTFVPEGTEMLVFILDQITSTNASLTKKILWHSINAPTVSGNSYTIVRNDLVSSESAADWPRQWSQGHVGTAAWASSINECPTGCTNSSTKYQYNGELQGWLTYPSTGVLTTVGGSGSEFSITDANGTTNHNACEFGTNCTTTVTVSSPGSGYVTGNTGTLSGCGDGTGTYTATASGGAVSSVTFSLDVSYTTIGSCATTATSGSGTGLTLTVINFGVGTTNGIITPQPLVGPHQSGSYRIEQTTSSAQTADQFVNVQYLMKATSTTTLSTPTTTPSGSNLVTAITITNGAGTCLVTVTQPVNGTGGTITASGAGCAAAI